MQMRLYLAVAVAAGHHNCRMSVGAFFGWVLIARARRRHRDSASRDRYKYSFYQKDPLKEKVSIVLVLAKVVESHDPDGSLSHCFY